MLCQVIVDIVHERVAQPFTYRVPEELFLQPGQRVQVPFGSRMREGIVISLSEKSDVPNEKLRSVIRVLEPYPAVLPQLMCLAEEMAETAHCPLAETLRLMLPAQMRGERVKARMVKLVRLGISPETLDAALHEERNAPKRVQLLQILSDGKPHLLKEIAEMVKAPADALRKLETKGLVVCYEEESLRRPGGEAVRTFPPPLTNGQQEVLAEIFPCLEEQPGRFLLHGVTGSGKTEVFMAAVSRTLELGKTAIILVPEIALTPQMVSWFRGRFGNEAAVLHSRLSPGERFDEWRRVRRGQARVVIGARSAVFAPAENLGLIVVDEEHETTYLNDHHPHYDAREVAASRCEREGATLILASATPSVLSFAKARRGDYMLLEMPWRVGNRPLPSVEIVDMRQELTSGNRGLFSRKLQEALKECVDKGEQAMLLLNHRGYHSFISCRACGEPVKCPHCDLSMTYHMEKSVSNLKCHYCGYECAAPSICPSCGSRSIRYFGAGTQKVEEEVQSLLPGVQTVRMDLDTTASKDGHAKLLEAFRSGRAKVMIGTQMIAKGLDFPKVTLVGILAADLTLNLPDYRSRERTFQLLTQAAGRAGRGSAPGKVLIQTYRPEETVIRQSAVQDYRSFFEEEFSRRRRSLYPPFTVLARILVEAATDESAALVANDVYQETLSALDEHPEWKKRTLQMTLDRPGVRSLRGKQRWHVLLKLLQHPDTEKFCGFLGNLAREKDQEVSVIFEYNPVTMM